MAEFEYDDSTLFVSRPLEERWPPLGMDSVQESGLKNAERNTSESNKEKLDDLEVEREELNGSLFALTNHFAQVQFRLKQVVASPLENREHLLKELEEFAFQGCPDVRGAKLNQGAKAKKEESLRDYELKLADEKRQQQSLIVQLKDQLEEMERCVARGVIEDSMTPEKLVEKQKIVIDELKTQLGFQLDSIDKMSDADVRKNVDNAIGQLMNPVKTKEELVKQLSNQIMDLERFVTFLQGEVEIAGERTETHCSCPCPPATEERSHKGKGKGKDKNTAYVRRQQEYGMGSQEMEYHHDYSLMEDQSDEGGSGCCLHVPSSHPSIRNSASARNKRLRETSLAIMKKALAILQIFAISQFGCTGQQLQDRLIQKATTVAAPGYLEFLARLKMAVAKVIENKCRENPYESDEPASPLRRSSDTLSRRSRTSSVSSVDTTMSGTQDKFNYMRDAELVNAVRKDLAMALKELFQHGLVWTSDNRLISSKSLVACIVPTTRTTLPKRMHIWELLMEFYLRKRGREYNSTPARRLSESFGIEVEGSASVTVKQTLLRMLHRIKTTHEPCRRSMDAMFKSFVCAALNQNRLTVWCRLIAKTSFLVDEHYLPWAYVVKTGMEEALAEVERLNEFQFSLPEDLAIRHLTKINDAFGETY